jgi:dGTPase
MMTYEQLLQPMRFSRRGELSLLEATETDRARVVQSAPVRRLQQKTQVFPLDVKASVRSRLTHSLEVQQVGRQICRALLKAKTASELPEMPLLNLLEMACLLHDVGNPPFGHFGESVLREWLRHHLPTLHSRSLSQAPSSLWLQTLLPDLLAFDGNAQSLRLVHSLQQMDLTYSLLATLIKVPQGIEDSAEFAQKIGYFYSERQLVAELRQTLGLQMGQRFPLVYLMEAADDLCYCIADLEDAVDRGLLNLFELQQYLTLAW